MANSADSDETAGYKPSYLDLHCLLGYLYWYVGMKELREMDTLSGQTALSKLFFTFVLE